MNNKEQPYKKIVLFDRTKTNRQENLILADAENYKEVLNTLIEPIEYISLQQVKPYFDVEIYNPKSYIFNEMTEIIKIMNDISNVLGLKNSKDIYIINRQAREVEHENKICIKYSYHFIVDKIRLNYNTLLELIKNKGYTNNKPFDLSVYKNNSGLYPIYSNKKNNIKTGKTIIVPHLLPYDTFKGVITEDIDITKYCPSYIEDNYEDYDIKNKPKEEINFDNKLCDDDDNNNNNNNTYNGNLNFTEIITKLSKERATNYNDWIYIIVALINLYYRKIITRKLIYDLADLFSSKADNYDADGVIKVIEYNINRFNGKGYGIKYILECLKLDDIEYYKSITKKELIIDGANDDIGASQIVVNHYKNELIICKGNLYVKFNDVWVSSKNEVDKILIDMIGKLDILFYGADGKRKYHYNKSIKHIKDCIICIRANQTIINDRFYDDMINNNKYYLPFNDGIYSFNDTKLYKYEELPNIHFTYKIDRNYPKFNQDDYNELMNRVIIPIYPNEEERQYNAHIKARALAGCYEDKKWYGYSGSRNSGKGVETNQLKYSFGEYVKSFNANCLVVNKFGNEDQSKALGWVVDKKDARIIISNEIDGDDNTKLNGALIKTLASGGDSMDGRRLYENTISFIPQFTIFLCYNKLFDFTHQDAKENLEEFEYKSKFVSKEELIEDCQFFKLKDDTIKDFIKEDRIIDAYTLYILNAFTNPRMKMPESIRKSTDIGKGETKLTIEQFISKHFKNTNDDSKRFHTLELYNILLENDYKISLVDTGRLFNRLGRGKYYDKVIIDKITKRGFKYLEYIKPEHDEQEQEEQ